MAIKGPVGNFCQVLVVDPNCPSQINCTGVKLAEMPQAPFDAVLFSSRSQLPRDVSLGC